MSATAAREAPDGLLQGSASTMIRWLSQTLEIDAAAGLALENHSGLSSRSRATPKVMAEIMAGAVRLPSLMNIPAKVDGALWPMLPRYGLPMADGEPDLPNVEVRAKSGTMYYGRGLAGYMLGENGRPLAFAIFTSDFSKRAKLDALPNPESRESPRGGKGWLRRAQYLERAILKSWTHRFTRATDEG